jgi:glycerol-3-phosphate acyltransferase PlsY
LKIGRTVRLPAAALAGYAIGSFPTADIVSRYAARHNGEHVAVDLRVAGTGNPGALNAAKILGWKWGAFVLAGDFIKGALASLAGRAVAGGNGTYAAGSGAVIGHCAPVWSGFRGGKGLATSAGTALVCFPAYMPIDVALAAATLAFSRGRAGLATYIASAVFICAAIFWWRSGKNNLWGPKPTAWLPLYALSSSTIIAYRFLSAPSTPESSVQAAEMQSENVEQATAVVS